MLSDEEKKAIEYWKTHMEILHWNTQLASEYYMKILLELIEKQSKEIEELKEDSCCMTNCVKRDKEKLFLEDKIKAKIEDIESQINDIKDNLDYEYNETMVNEVWRLENKIDVLQSLLEKE